MVKRAFGLGKKHVFKRVMAAEISASDARLILGGFLVIAVIVFSLLFYKASLGSSASSSTQKTSVAATTDTVNTKDDATTPVVKTQTPATTETTPVAQQPTASSTETATPATTQTTSTEDAEYQAWLDKVCPGTQQWIDAMNQRYEGYAVDLFKTNDPRATLWKTYYEKCVAAGRLTALY